MRRVRIGDRGVGPARREIDEQRRQVVHVLEQGGGLRIMPQTDRETFRLIPAAQCREREGVVPGDPGHPRVPPRRVRAVPSLGDPEHLLESAGPEHRLGEEHARQPFVPGVLGLAVPGNRIAQGLDGAFVLARTPLELPLEHPDRRQLLHLDRQHRDPARQQLRRGPEQARALALDRRHRLVPSLAASQ